MSFERYRLRMSPRWMTLEPADSTLQVRQVLFIDRTSCEVSLRERLEVAALSKATSDEIVYGLVGIANSYIDRYVAAACLALVSTLVCHAFFTQSCMDSAFLGAMLTRSFVASVLLRGYGSVLLLDFCPPLKVSYCGAEA